MFSGKSDELIKRIKVATAAGSTVVAAKPKIEVEPDCIVSLTGARWPATPIDASSDLLSVSAGADVVALDEAQFMDLTLQPVVDRLRRRVRLLVAGLDLDFRGEPFGLVTSLIEDADDVTRLTASCEVCGRPATRTQRLVGGAPAPREAPTIVVGGRELYEPRCERCFVRPE
jgi:thymidine kinase